MKDDVVIPGEAEIRPDLNTLCYQVLGVLLRRPRSGYEIVKQLESVRPVKTSQIYPTLARLEKLGLVVSDDVTQQGRPNKRVYSVTDRGQTTLKEWVGTEPAPPVWRDEFLTMLYSAWTKEPEDVVAMFQRRLTYLEDTIDMLRDRLAEHRAKFSEELMDPRDWRFYREILINRRLCGYEQELVWSRSVIYKLKEFIEHERAQDHLPDS